MTTSVLHGEVRGDGHILGSWTARLLTIDPGAGSDRDAYDWLWYGSSEPLWLDTPLERPATRHGVCVVPAGMGVPGVVAAVLGAVQDRA